jgi:hypothetical protein
VSHKNAPKKRLLSNVIDKIEADLAYRLPTSNKQMSCIVLSREQAEQLLQEVYELRLQAEGRAS